jgi:hypothetical protein
LRGGSIDFSTKGIGTGSESVFAKGQVIKILVKTLYVPQKLYYNTY